MQLDGIGKELTINIEVTSVEYDAREPSPS